MAFLLLRPSNADAIPLLNGLGGPAGYGTGILATNDDGSTPVISLLTAFPHGLNFYRTGSAYFTSVYVNNNGNVSFGTPLSAYTPGAFPGAPAPIIAPWWGDVDTRSAAAGSLTNTVYYDIRPGQFTVTWHMVGYYSEHTNLTNDFQVIITDASATGTAGDFDVEFRYNQCQWTTGDASGGSGGLGGTPAQAGFDAGDGMAAHSTTLPGSRTAAILNVCTTSNTSPPVPGDWRYQVHGGGVAVCGNCILESGEQCDYCTSAPVPTCSHTCHNRVPLGGTCTTADDCLSGIPCIAGTCTNLLPPGATCTSDPVCSTGHCVDGVCCNSTCTGQCQSCNATGTVGTCSTVTGTPRGTRPACTGTGACTGTCDGTSATTCTYPGSSVVCSPPSCTAGTATLTSYCNGMGLCPPATTMSCGALACGSLACLTMCAADTDCAMGNVCVSGACVPELPPGMACMRDGQCLSGHCVDGVCCDTACNGQCQACDVATHAGTCTQVMGTPHGTRAACAGTGACAGTCDGSQAMTCTYPGTTTSCRDASCTGAVAVTAATCDGMGACNAPGPAPCAPYACTGSVCGTACAQPTDCASGNYCNELSQCVPLPTGTQGCATDGDCRGGSCVDGICCDQPCTGACQSCRLTGQVGHCAPLPAGTAPTTQSDGGTPACTVCDGTGACGNPATDAGSGVDASVDVATDAGTANDATIALDVTFSGSGTATASSGCGCTTQGRPRGRGAYSVALALAAAWAARRRRSSPPRA